jgi:hypothetical protein
MNNNRLAWAEALLSEGGRLSLDTAFGLMGEGIDISTIEDRIDGFVITEELLESLENYESY